MAEPAAKPTRIVPAAPEVEKLKKKIMATGYFNDGTKVSLIGDNIVECLAKGLEMKVPKVIDLWGMEWVRIGNYYKLAGIHPTPGNPQRPAKIGV